MDLLDLFQANGLVDERQLTLFSLPPLGIAFILTFILSVFTNLVISQITGLLDGFFDNIFQSFYCMNDTN